MRRLLMATRTIHFAVCACKREMRALGVIEFPNGPTIGCVAVSALGAKTALVYVVTLVAVVTGFTNALVGEVLVALHARHGDVQADQWEIR
jgi:hypothetical protein